MEIRRKLIHRNLTIGVALLHVGCATLQGTIDDRTRIENGEIIEVSGFLIYEYENRNLYNSLKDSEKYSSSKQCLSISSEVTKKNLIETYNRKWVVVKGKYIKDFCGKDVICPDSCSQDAIVVDSITSR